VSYTLSRSDEGSVEGIFEEGKKRTSTETSKDKKKVSNIMNPSLTADMRQKNWVRIRIELVSILLSGRQNSWTHLDILWGLLQDRKHYNSHNDCQDTLRQILQESQ
jgi:hypothetical protein